MKIQLNISRKLVSIIIVLVVISIVSFLLAHNWTSVQKMFIKPQKSNITISSSNELTTEEINSILKSVAAVQCTTYQTPDHKGDPVFGSGSYITVADPQTKKNIDVLVTNAHVAEDPSIRNSNDSYGLCTINFNHVNKEHYYYFHTFQGTSILNDNQDLAILTPELNNGIEKDISPLNQGGSPIPFCMKVTTGEKVYIFGYPGSSDSFSPSPEPEKGKDILEWMAWGREIQKYSSARNLVVTDGIISGKRGEDYFTTAKIDAGNSGGIAVAKEEGRVCLVGIPTWVSVGQFDYLGIIQPFENIYQANIKWDKLLNRIPFAP